MTESLPAFFREMLQTKGSAYQTDYRERWNESCTSLIGGTHISLARALYPVEGFMMMTQQTQAARLNPSIDEGNFHALWLEIETTLLRVEGALNHYEVLGIDGAGTILEVNLAYKQTVTLLQPSFSRAEVSLPTLTLGRIDRAMQRITHAFNVLSSPSSRAEYDSYMNPCEGQSVFAEGANVLLAPPSSLDDREPESDFESIRPEMIEGGAERFSDLMPSLEENRRKFERYSLSLPAYVTGSERGGSEWHEMTHTIDVSRIGALLCLKRRVPHRSVLHLAMPMPMKLRCHRHCEPSYGVYAIVRRVERHVNGSRVIAVEFVGESAPSGYLERPWATYSTRWGGRERRREFRKPATDVVRLEFLNEAMQKIKQEAAVTENLSSGGMRVSAHSVPDEFDLIKVTGPGGSFERLAAVCNRYIGKDRQERLCLQFI